MKKYLLLYKSTMPMEEMMKNADPATSMEPWMKWFEGHKADIVEMGSPTGNQVDVTKVGNVTPTEFVGGYTVVQAESRDAVIAMLSNHPQFMTEDGSIEVLEIFSTPGM